MHITSTKRYATLQIRALLSASLIMLATIAIFPHAAVHASTPTTNSRTQSGLKASTTRIALQLKAGETKNARVTINNDSTRDMIVEFDVQRLHINPRTHKLQLQDQNTSWVSAHIPSSHLIAGQQREITYRVEPPHDTPEKEYYFALIARTTVKDGHSSKTLQVATLLYVYVDGGHQKKSGDITHASLPWFSVNPTIPYSITIKNTGNIHLSTSAEIWLQAATWKGAPQASYHVTMPNSSETINGRLTSPMYPGLYQVHFHQKDPITNEHITVASWQLIYLPPWSIATSIVLLLTGIYLWQRRHVRPTAV